MGSKRNRRKEGKEEWEAMGTVEDFTNGSGNLSGLHDTAAVGERGDSNGIDQTNSQSSGGRSRQGKGDNSSQLKHKVTLGPWTQAVSEVVQEMGAAQRAIKNLQSIFTIHTEDLDMIDVNKTRLDQLEEEGREKDEEIQRQENTINTLRSMDNKARASIQEEVAKMDRAKEELKQDRGKLNARIEVAMAEKRLSMDREFQERMTKHDKDHETRRKELEAEFAQKSIDNNTIVIALGAEKERLSATVQQQATKTKAQADELENITERYDLLERAKNSLRSEKQALKTELENMKKEFALNTKPTAYLYEF